MYCQSCGKETPEQAMFCLHCGVRINKECPRCAEMIRFKARACRFCGFEFNPEDTLALQQEEEARLEELERERKETEMREKLEQEEKEYARWHRPDAVSKWGPMVLQCSECSTLNPISTYVPQFPPKEFGDCRRCGASLETAVRIENPYVKR